MRICVPTLALTLLLAACGDAPPPQAAPDAGPAAAASAQTAAPTPAPAASTAGDYTMSGERTGTLALREAGAGAWFVHLQGGGAPSDGAGVAADCEIQARGPLRGDRIEAAVVPFESARMSVTPADLERRPARVTVTLDGDVAEVTTDFTLCAMHADLDGRYRRGTP